MSGRGSVVALCGGIGGAKLALGLSHVVPAKKLSIIVNVGDDFRHFGLAVSPDVDTVLYTLSGRVNPATGWGRNEETWRFMEAVGELGGETWFNLGDTDLAMHAVRTARLAAGARPTEITAAFARALGIAPAILPATDAHVPTVVETDEGVLPFQRYFVGLRCAPVVRTLRYHAADEAEPTPEVKAALNAPDLAAIILCPSNPYLSIDPMLAIPGLRYALATAKAPTIAVSPLVGGDAVKGPLAKMMDELGHARTSATILAHYGDLVDLLLLDERDAAEATDPRMAVAKTMMVTLEDRIALARACLAAADRLAGRA
ncbi:2-phospho-L-lactate transferase [Acuticoccus mangrovi]|uniref:2-phospho-L-lactate transferase n=1 Tax=Acuticoccus mangrovi TaxID=2796142 RepID=A0A934IS18_9HYPH|nr:2-phospho-L-lactate transferase [Acuticoccus mangrovi]MBJ3776619.1 2-phospho-L-lactate transferase [Acuticoccus mangrovi]